MSRVTTAWNFAQNKSIHQEHRLVKTLVIKLFYLVSVILAALEYFGPEYTKEAQYLLSIMNITTEEDKPLTDLMMTMWTNFAKSGWVANNKYQ